ncbi:hypothetical protein GCM10022376_33460 [Yimella lutea]
MSHYTTDPDREDHGDLTGLRALALKNGKVQPVDIAELDAESLTRYLRSRGGKNPFCRRSGSHALGARAWRLDRRDQEQ